MPDLLTVLQPWHWALLAVVLLTLEVFAPGVFFIWMGLAAGLVAALFWLFPELSWQGQILTFAGLSILAAVLGRKWLDRHPLATDKPALNRRGEQYIGRTFTLQEPIVNGEGKIQVDDTTWKIRGPDCEAASNVTVTGVDGVVLLVDCGSSQG